jgi:hypothetical protein
VGIKLLVSFGLRRKGETYDSVYAAIETTVQILVISIRGSVSGMFVEEQRSKDFTTLDVDPSLRYIRTRSLLGRLVVIEQNRRTELYHQL